MDRWLAGRPGEELAGDRIDDGAKGKKKTTPDRAAAGTLPCWIYNLASSASIAFFPPARLPPHPEKTSVVIRNKEAAACCAGA